MFKTEMDLKRTISEEEINEGIGGRPGTFCTTFEGFVTFCRVYGKVYTVPFDFIPSSVPPEPGMVVMDGHNQVYSSMRTDAGCTWIRHAKAYIKDVDLLVEFTLPGFTDHRFIPLADKLKEELHGSVAVTPLAVSADYAKSTETLSAEKTDAAVEAFGAFRELRDTTLPDMWRHNYMVGGYKLLLRKSMLELLQVKLLTYGLMLEFDLELAADLSLKNPVKIYPKNVATAVFMIGVDLWDA